MSRSGEWAADQESRDLEDAALHQYEQELLQRDPAFAQWLDKLNAGIRDEQEQAMNLNDMSFDQLVPSESKYLAKGDVGEDGVILTIAGFTEEVLKGDDGDERKIVIHWEESPDYKPMILNRTNCSLLAVVTGTHRAGDAIGKQVVVYNDPTISFGGKITGGLRIKKLAGAPRTARAAGDIPF